MRKTFFGLLFLLSLLFSFSAFAKKTTSDFTTASSFCKADTAIIVTDSCPTPYTDIWWYHYDAYGLLGLTNNYECYNYDSLYFIATPYSYSSTSTQWTFVLNGKTVVKYGSSIILKWTDFLPTVINRSKKANVACINNFSVTVKPIRDSCVVASYGENAANSEACILSYLKGNFDKDNNENLSSQVRVTTFPNPAKNTITITLNTENITENTTSAFQIYNTNGKLLKSGYLKNYTTIVNIQDLTSGTYIIKTQYGSKVFVKN